MNIRFLHAADIHLDSPFKGIANLSASVKNQLLEATYQAFSTFIDYAVDTAPDFVLLVGDIYDGENRSLRAQKYFQTAMERLHVANIPVFLVHGNHDHLGGRWTRFQLPENVRVFGAEVEEKELQIRGDTVRLVGFSYGERHIRQEMIYQYPAHQPTAYYTIGLLHGSEASDITHSVYAPFTKQQLLEKNYHYWALGHIHLRQLMHEHPAIVYPGNLQGRHQKEQGEKGFYDVTLTPSETNLTFVRTGQIMFDKIVINCSTIEHANDWFALCEQSLTDYSQTHGAAMIELVACNLTEAALQLFATATDEEWLAETRALFDDFHPLVWIQRISFERYLSSANEVSMLAEAVQDKLLNWSTDEMESLLQDLFRHPKGRKHLEQLTPDVLNDLRQETVAFIANELSSKK